MKSQSGAMGTGNVYRLVKGDTQFVRYRFDWRFYSGKVVLEYLCLSVSLCIYIHIFSLYLSLSLYIYILSTLLFSMNYVQHILGRWQLHMYAIAINGVPVCTCKYRYFVRLEETDSWFQFVMHYWITSVEKRTVSTLSREHTYKVSSFYTARRNTLHLILYLAGADRPNMTLRNILHSILYLTGALPSPIKR